MQTLALVAAGLAAALAATAVAVRTFVGRAQDRLARTLLETPGAAYKLLTRGELCGPGRHRRLPGVVGLTDGAIVFHGVFGETRTLPTDAIQKIVTGTRLADGRVLLRREVLRLTRREGEELQFVLSRASASAWRSHLGLWAVEERRAAMDVVTPGKR
ncbi:MAG TPA: hypothetical protein VKG23_12680 [Thermoanaerobaculia bacterium]|nr:hypothetical protein [Thermoanaerobaculia bacterium]